MIKTLYFFNVCFSSIAPLFDSNICVHVNFKGELTVFNENMFYRFYPPSIDGFLRCVNVYEIKGDKANEFD